MNREAHVPAICEFYRNSLLRQRPLHALALSRQGQNQGDARLPRDSDAEIRSSSETRRALAVAETACAAAFREAAPRRLVEGNHRQQSLPRSAAAFDGRREFLLENYSQPVLVEEYLPGQEFTCAVLGNGERSDGASARGNEFRYASRWRSPDLQLRCEVRLGSARKSARHFRVSGAYHEHSFRRLLSELRSMRSVFSVVATGRESMFDSMPPVCRMCSR